MMRLLRRSLLLAVVMLLLIGLAPGGSAQARSIVQVRNLGENGPGFYRSEDLPPFGQPKPTPPPTDAGAPPAGLPYPSQAEMKADIAYYYTHVSEFREKNSIRIFDTITHAPFDNSAPLPRFAACARYEFAPLKSPQKIQTAYHEFTFQYDNHSWRVIGMDPFHSCD